MDNDGTVLDFAAARVARMAACAMDGHDLQPMLDGTGSSCVRCKMVVAWD